MSGSDLAHQDRGDNHEHQDDVGEESNSSTDNGYVSDEGSWPDYHEETAVVRNMPTSIPTSIPTGADIKFDPAAPTHNLTVVSGPHSLYFATLFIDCEFDEGCNIKFDDCIFSVATFTKCQFRGTCIFTRCVFKDCTAIKCVFDDSWHTNRAFQVRTHVSETYIGDRAIDPVRGLPRAMADTTWITSQEYNSDTWRVPVEARDDDDDLAVPQASQDLTPPDDTPASKALAVTVAAIQPDPVAATASTRVAKSSSVRMVSVIPIEADVQDER